MKVARLVTPEGEKAQINISVRNLVEFLLREGDIDDRKGSVDPFEAMQEGSRIHRKIQNSMGPFYRAEVPLKYQVEYDDYIIGLEGRADGVVLDMDEDGTVWSATVDEIKGMYMDVMTFEKPVLVHEAQAKCYAYMIASEYNLPEIDVQMTYVSLETEEIKRFNQTYSFDEIEEWFLTIINIFKKWADFQYYHKQEVLESVQGLEFPYEYRDGQKKLVSDVYRSIYRRKILFMQAPTGTGKTIANVFPAVMALGQNLAERVFYLTAKTATALAARDAYSLLSQNGYEGRTIMLTAKEKMCLCDEADCNPDNCPYARGHFDRVNDVIYEIITKETVITRDVVLGYAEEYVVCPFELALDVSTWCEGIICDYNYVFDPNVYLKRFFAEGRNGEHIFLIDEAHNMVDRAREMYSETLIKEEILSIKRYAKPVSKKLVNALEKCNRIMLEYKRECDRDITVLSDIDMLLNACDNLQMIFEQLFKKEVKFGIYQDEVLDFYFRLRNFTALAYQQDPDHYRIYCDFDDDKNFNLHLYCIDPSAQLQQRLAMARATVYFSATLLPIDYYKDLLCNITDVYAIYVDSVFEQQNRLLLLGTDVTSKYTRRGEDEYVKFARYIQTIVNAKQGNYMVFGPSYKFLEDIHEKYQAFGDDVEIIIQQQNMTEQEREDFLLEFEKKREKSMVAFCTLGGIFSEGIDLVGGKLIGSIILGAGLPQVGNERKLMSDFFDDEGKNGFEYAYLYPGMNKVIQAAGRLIRTKDDIGVIALLDERFRFGSYRKTFPREWNDAEFTTVDEVSLKLTNFWKKKD
ncbi:ATP-dependent DNA helicase [Pseudobutyrivibrio xylanivorans]|uniref:Rad3-related DNA helicase n=1 Tax=Pseudobutyrivibrio xylanivorans TaxID=185007 RepID=A0A1G5RUD0_PSEXY|nr:ATP-dependent DNA helicase [Pseudobutyrivibrio xylanivorans]SCZ77606.1 Rad3-related DNA helicase [Pseudobutyrivibrio xylanivorans]